jgi:predicted nuclease with TOPRIM domain
MHDLTIFKAKVLTTYTATKVKASLDEIKEKNGHRTDLIDSMEATFSDLNEIRRTIDEMEKELRFVNSSVFRLERICLELKAENKELKNEIKALITEL